MGIEFRLGRSDHKVAEDFVVHRPAGVDGVWLDAHNVRFQSGVVETAKAAGIEVLVEPLTERLVAEGFAPSGLPYAVDGPVDLVLCLLIDLGIELALAREIEAIWECSDRTTRPTHQWLRQARSALPPAAVGGASR